MIVLAGYLPAKKGKFDETIYAQHDDHNDAGYGAYGLYRWNIGGASRDPLCIGRSCWIQTTALDVSRSHGIWHFLSGRPAHGVDTWCQSIDQFW